MRCGAAPELSVHASVHACVGIGTPVRCWQIHSILNSLFKHMHLGLCNGCVAGVGAPRPAAKALHASSQRPNGQLAGTVAEGLSQRAFYM
eukprot:366045-Chlamydomonas_euryale.AAC.6